jgi:hypothetical protein
MLTTRSPLPTFLTIRKPTRDRTAKNYLRISDRDKPFNPQRLDRFSVAYIQGGYSPDYHTHDLFLLFPLVTDYGIRCVPAHLPNRIDLSRDHWKIPSFTSF